MRCEKHNIEMNEVCGEQSCGACYGEALEQERYVPQKPFMKIEEWMWKGTLAKTMRGIGSGETG